MAKDAESDIAIRFVDENDYRDISAKAVSAKRKLKKNRPSSRGNSTAGKSLTHWMFSQDSLTMGDYKGSLWFTTLSEKKS